MFMSETYAPILLEIKAKKLREQYDDPLYRSKFASNFSRKLVFEHAIIRPLKLLFMSPIVSLLSLHMAVMFSLLYLLFTTFTYVFQETYGFSTGSAGLTFLGMGVGQLIGIVTLGPLVDKVYIFYVKKNHGAKKPEFRLPVMVFTSLTIPIGLFWYGWSAEKHAPYMVPIVGTSFIGFGMLAVMVRDALYDAIENLTDIWHLLVGDPKLPR